MSDVPSCQDCGQPLEFVNKIHADVVFCGFSCRTQECDHE